MTFEEFIESTQSLCWSEDARELVEMVWRVAQEAERERIKSRAKEAAENLWCIRNQVGEEPYSLYIGP